MWLPQLNCHGTFAPAADLASRQTAKVHGVQVLEQYVSRHCAHIWAVHVVGRPYRVVANEPANAGGSLCPKAIVVPSPSAKHIYW